MNLLNKVSQHLHTCAICESAAILYSAFKSPLVFKAYLVSNTRPLNAFHF